MMMLCGKVKFIIKFSSLRLVYQEEHLLKWLLHYSAQDAITKYYRWSPTQQVFVFSVFWRLKPEVRAAGSGSGEGLFLTVDSCLDAVASYGGEEEGQALGVSCSEGTFPSKGPTLLISSSLIFNQSKATSRSHLQVLGLHHARLGHSSSMVVTT